MKKMLSGIGIFLLITKIILAQSAGAVWLQIPSSATFSAMGEIGVCLPDDDIYAEFFNPANGISGYEGISLNYSENNIRWLPNLANDLVYDNYVIGLGLLPKKSPFQLVLTKSRHFLNRGQNMATDEHGNYIGSFNPHMESENIGFAAGYSSRFVLPFDISVGFERKRVIQNLADHIYQPIDNGEITALKSENIFYDAGLLVSIPYQKSQIKPEVNLSVTPSLGYSISNYGDEIYFTEFSKGDPGPRLARFGVSITAKLTHQSGWNLLTYKGGRAAADLLITNQDKQGDFDYQRGLGDINIADHILLTRNRDGLELHRGNELEFLDLLAIRYGRRIDKQGDANLHQWGLGLQSDGIFHLLNYYTGKQEFNILPYYLSIEWNFARWVEEPGHPLDDIEYRDFTLRARNLNKLFTKDADYFQGLDRSDGFLDQNILSSFKVIFGANLSKIRFKEDHRNEEWERSWLTGFTAAIESKLYFLNFGLGYDRRGSTFLESDWPTGDIQLVADYLTIYSHYSFDVGDRLVLFAGIESGYPLNIEYRFDKHDYEMDQTEMKMDIGLIGGIDIRLIKNLGIRCNYYHGLGRVLEKPAENFKNQTIGLKTFIDF